MDHIALLERPPEEVSVPSSASSSRFTGLAVLAAVAAVVLGITALGGPGSTLSGGSQLAVNGSAAGQQAGSGSGQAMAPPAAPAGSSGSAGHQAAPGDAGAGAGASGSQQAPVEYTVSMEGLKFVPAALTVAVGDTVTWVNNDTASHTVTISDGPEMFESDLLAPGDSFKYTFTMPGQYNYYCAVHPDMKASVLVTGASAPPADGSVPPVPVDNSAGCVPSSAFGAGSKHIQFAHLQTAPGQQAADLLSLDQYIKTHTVLAQNMAQPIFDGVVTDASAKSLDLLMAHIQNAHLQESPGQQAADILSLDQYVKTHTVLIGDMVAPHAKYLAC